jgi:tetratricopeptide (TPR) repeat protein
MKNIAILIFSVLSISFYGQTEIEYTNNGNAKAATENFKAAIEDYTKAIEINPKYYKAYNNRGSYR